MKIHKYIIAFIVVAFVSCEKPEIFSEEKYNCQSIVPEEAFVHPKAEQYQEILNRNQKLELVGASLMIKDDNGIWVGSVGKGDIASNIDVKPCNRFLIASITKSFTATVIFKYIDQGLLSLNDNAKDYLPASIYNKLENSKEAKIKHLLNHTSGIPDYYTIDYELDRINEEYNNWSQYDIIKYAFNQDATNTVGETYEYSNSNYLLLGIILERISGKLLEEIYSEEIFNPLNLSSGYYSANNSITDDTVKGYVDLYGNGQYVESQFLYKDELGTADGGIAMNAYDLGLFYEGLFNENLISDNSLNEMTNWFPLPSDWVDDDFGHFQNGYGLERNDTPYGNSVGHTGGIDGFLSIAQYFPESDKTFVLLVNSGSYENQARINIYNEVLELMFE